MNIPVSLARLKGGKKMSRELLYLALLIFSALALSKAIVHLSILYFAMVLIPFLIYFCIEKPFLFPFGLYALLLPFDSVLAITGSSRGATLTKLCGILTILVLSLKGLLENRMKLPGRAAVWWALFVLYGVTSMWWAVRPELTLTIVPTAVGLLLLYAVTSSFELKDNELETFKWCILIGGTFAAVLTAYLTATGYYYHQTQRASIMVGERLTNPNKAAQSLLIPLSLSLRMILIKKEKLMKSLSLIMLITIIFGIVVTGSRSSILGAFAIFIIYVVYSGHKLSLGLVLCAAGIPLILFAPEFFANRWGGTVESGGAGRLDIWTVAAKSLGKYWLSGAGLENFTIAHGEFAHRMTGIGKDPHNIFLQTFVELGVAGVSLVIIAIVSHYVMLQKACYKNRLDAIMLKAACLGIVVHSFFHASLWDKPFWLIWMMIMMQDRVTRSEPLEQADTITNRSWVSRPSS